MFSIRIIPIIKRMFFYPFAVIYLVMFYAGLELAAFVPGTMIYVLPFFVILSFWSVRKTKRIMHYGFTQLFFMLSSMALLYFIDVDFSRHIFISLSNIILYLGLVGFYRLSDYAQDRTAQGLVVAELITATFFSFATLYAVYLNFILSLWILMLIFFAVSAVVSFKSFKLVIDDNKKILGLSLVLGLIMAELAWIIHFWPFGYLTTGVVCLIFYYLFWDLVYSRLMNVFTKKRVIVNVCMFFLVVSCVLLSSRWFV